MAYFLTLDQCWAGSSGPRLVLTAESMPGKHKRLDGEKHGLHPQDHRMHEPDGIHRM